MSETILELRVSTDLLQFGLDHQEIQRRVTEWLALSLFTEGRISSGKAARLLNISRVDFLALLHARGIAYINYNSEEIAEEFDAVKAFEFNTIP